MEMVFFIQQIRTIIISLKFPFLLSVLSISKMATAKVVSAQTAFQEEKPQDVEAVKVQEEDPAAAVAESTPAPTLTPVAIEEAEKEEEKKEITTASKETVEADPEPVDEVAAETTKEVVVVKEAEVDTTAVEEAEKPIIASEEVEKPVAVKEEAPAAVPETVKAEEPAAGGDEGAPEPEEKKVAGEAPELVVKTE
ncbi:hypothetical protein LINPERHAP1_LOCUS8723 [Linum perenne]